MTDAASWEQNINNVLMEGIYTNSDFNAFQKQADMAIVDGMEEGCVLFAPLYQPKLWQSLRRPSNRRYCGYFQPSHS